jgi:chaperone required for assembly of F1-ATPase
VKTPAKAALILPTRAMAETIAAEWDAQGRTVDPRSMPVTRAANSAIDKVAVQFDEVARLLADYGGSDLLCYRAIGPAALTLRQEAAWDPLLDWAATSLGAPLNTTRGVVHVAQPADSLARLTARITALGPFHLAAVHDLIAISGSLVLALAIIDGRLTLEEAWDASRIDETWQAEQWGEDEDAAAQEALRKTGFLQAGRFFALCG